MSVSGTRLMTEGVIWRQIFSFSVPLIIGNVFQQFYNIVDSLVIGNYLGGDALAAVGAGNVMINIMIGLFSGLSAGAGVLIARFFGSRDEWGIRESVHTAAAFTICAGIAITAFGISISNEILEITNTPPEVFEDARTFLLLYFSGIIPLLVYNMGAAILRAVGDSRTPLYFLALASVLNAIFVYTAVAVLGMGIRSVPIATVMAQTIAAVLVVWKLIKTTEVYRLDIWRIRFNPRILWRTLRIGIPAGLQSALMGISNLVVQSRVNGYGTHAMAAWNIYGRIDSLMVMPIVSFGLAMMTFTGQNIGAGLRDRVYKGTVSGLVMSCSLAVTISVIICASCSWLLSMFTGDPEILYYGGRMIFGLAPFYFLVAVMYMLIGVINGAGYSLATMLIMLANLFAVRIAVLYFEAMIVSDIGVVFHAYIASWAMCSLGLWLYYKRGGWRRSLDQYI
ncbi:MAG: MATE family efflux transporter [Synergistaceae bacterium]|nr:MATE family efflux transporter [Synergistaceae bacterium]